MQNGISSGDARRIAGLDTLRFFAALWVAFSHGARLPVGQIMPAGPLAQALQSLNNAAFNGVAAVMVFFVISGFAIHLPQAGTDTVRLLPHFTRRLLRILPPLYASIIIGRLLGLDPRTLQIGIYWSIYCEIIYYLTYPALLLGFRRFGIMPVLLASAVAASAFIIGTWPILYWDKLSLLSAAVIGLPCWLLGCLLATRLHSLPPVTLRTVWAWRFSALVLSMALKVPVTHGPLIVGYSASHWIFALFAFFWLQKEIAWGRERPPVKIFEHAGQWSYSIYLIHGFVLAGFARFSWQYPLAMWAAQFVAIFACSYAFYRLVEAPSHLAARRMSRFFMRRRAAA